MINIQTQITIQKMQIEAELYYSNLWMNQFTIQLCFWLCFYANILIFIAVSDNEIMIIFKLRQGVSICRFCMSVCWSDGLQKIFCRPQISQKKCRPHIFPSLSCTCACFETCDIYFTGPTCCYKSRQTHRQENSKQQFGTF